MTKKSSLSQIFSLSFLALPLAFVGVPIYLNIADFYARSFGLSLALIGGLLLAIRLIDALCDPLIGYFSDKLAQRKISHKRLIYLGLALLSLSFYFVFNPPKTLTSNLAVIWFFGSLTLTYFFFNLTIINFESLVALTARDDSERLKINSIKEFLGIIGMIFAFLIPVVLSNFFALDQRSSYLVLSLCFAVFTLVAAGVFLRKVNVEEKAISTSKLENQSFLKVFADKKFLALLAIFLINGVAVSLPAANLNFYVRDVLGKESELGWFLTVYFLSACLFMPLWGVIAMRLGAIRTWILSIFGSVLTFFCAYFLGQSSANYFYLICFLSGLFLGPDLITPPALLAKITAKNKSLTSSYFALWNLVTKTSLMIAASGSLIALGYLGYKPGEIFDRPFAVLPFFYALLPCFIKVFIILLLTFFSKKSFFHENN